MKAVVYEGPYKVAVRDIDDPVIAEPNDARSFVTFPRMARRP
jgi:hypothetical protein